MSWEIMSSPNFLVENLAISFCYEILMFLRSQHHPLNRVEKCIHHFIIKSKTTCIRVRGVEIEPCCMNRTMESMVPSFINHTPLLSSSCESLLHLVLIVAMDSFFGPIHVLIQVAHCKLLTINQTKNLYQRFTDGTYLHSCPKSDQIAPFELWRAHHVWCYRHKQFLKLGRAGSDSARVT